MSVHHVFAVGFLTVGVGVELVCCLGVLLARQAMDRLHFLGPATSLGPILIAAAVLSDRSGPQADIKSVLVALVLLLTGPILSYATAHAVVADPEEQSA